MTGVDLARLRKVCGLLGSEHQGERAAAALKATAILNSGGKTWADISFGTAAHLAQAYADAALVDIFKRSLATERAHTTQMAQEITRLKREVNRLKGMWPKSKAKVAA